MSRLIPPGLVAIALVVPAAALDAPPVAPAPRVSPQRVVVTVESSLATKEGQIRQFAFDGDPTTCFASEKPATKDDHFTLRFDVPVALKSVRVRSGTPDNADVLAAGTLEASTDGESFEPLAKFVDGGAWAKPGGKRVRAVRLTPGDLSHPLVIRDIAIDSDPPVAVFKYPIEFVLDVSDAPEMKEWGEKVVRVCERQYPLICEELMSDGFKPMTVIRMTLRANYKGVAAAGGGRITGSVRYFKDRPDDIGAMVHETVHCVQSYRGRGNPGWLVEGVADYYRFFKYEPGKLGIRLTPERAKYDGSYRVSAAFLAFLVEKYDPFIVKKLNAAMREGRYRPEVWKNLTGKTVEELGREWQNSLAK